MDLIAQDAAPTEQQVKAAFLLNFPRYVEWPPEVLTTRDEPIVIAVLGDSPVTTELRKTVAGRSVNGRRIVIRQAYSGNDAADAHILFVSVNAQNRYLSLLSRMDHPVLTVGESAEFLRHGGMVNLALKDRKVALEVNLAAATKSRIKISSKLLSVAGVVKGR